MKHRMLRIAWSVVWGIATLLTIVLWVRSNWWIDQVVQVTSNAIWQCCEYDGQMVFSWSDDAQRASAYSAQIGEGWHLTPFTVQQWHQISPPPPGQRILRAFHSTPNEFVAPFWAVTLVALAAASLAWIDRVRLHFTLRTMLIAVTLVAMILGIVMALV
jgi:hypothetical protein